MFTFLPRLLRPSREGALRLHPIKRAPGAFVNSASPMSGALLVFCVNQGISASFSLLYFLIVDSGPPGSGPLKDLNKWCPEQVPGTCGRFGQSDLKGLLGLVSTKTWVKRLESRLTFLLYFSTYLKFRDFQFHLSE